MKWEDFGSLYFNTVYLQHPFLFGETQWQIWGKIWEIECDSTLKNLQKIASHLAF